MRRVWPLLLLAACGGDDELAKARAVRFVSTHLPLVVIDTAGVEIPNEPKVPATMRIVFEAAPYEGRVGIELRGATSRMFPKKQFGIELRDAKDADMDASLLGMPEEEDWVLLGPWRDRSLVRNRLALETARSLGQYAARSRFVELLLVQGDAPQEEYYWGVYMLMEKIKRDEHRVDIKRLRKKHNDEPHITGGYILEMVRAAEVEDGDLVFETSRGARLQVHEPKARRITPAQTAWIQEHMRAFESGFDDGTWRDIADEESIVDFVILHELFRNPDSFHASTFVHKERGGPLVFGPVWDFDVSLGNNWQDSPEGWDLKRSKPWARELAQDGAFIDAVIARWRALRKGLLTDAVLLARVDAAVKELGDAAARDMQRWGGDHEDEVRKLKDFLVRRTAWMDRNIETLKR